MKNQTHPLRTAVAGAVLASAGLTSFSALAAAPERPGAAARAEIQQTYRAERAACTDGSSTQARGACLAEAAAVRKEALAGVLGLQTVARSAEAQPTEPDLLANALSRCDAVPSDVRGDCEQRVIGGGGVIVVGSVAEGVIVRELAPAAAPTRVAQVAPDNARGGAAATATADPLPVIVAEPNEPPMEAAPAGAAAAADARAQGLDDGETLVPVDPALAARLPAEPAAASSPADDAKAERPVHPAIDAAAETVAAPTAAPATEPAIQADGVTEPADEPMSTAPAVQSDPVRDDPATPEWQVQQRFE